MQQVLHLIMAFVLSMSVVMSTTSFSVYNHFCGAFLQDVSLIVPSDGCSMETMDGCAMSLEKSCCSDHQEVLQGQDNLQLHVGTAHKFQLNLPEYFNCTQGLFELCLPVDIPALPLFHPPPDSVSLYILYESYLI